MKGLMVQGHGFYGFNLRAIPDDVAEKLTKQHLLGNYEVRFKNELGEPGKVDMGVDLLDLEGFMIPTINGWEAGTQVVMLGEKSIGFDTGVWDEAEELINSLLATVDGDRKNNRIKFDAPILGVLDLT